MWKVVNDASGTAKAARITGVEVAGKTGTAQNWRRNEKGVRVEDNHTLFISFAPYLNAKYSVCILVQGGKSGGGCAAPVAQRVLEQALALDNGYDPHVQPLEEVPGNFNKVESVSYADNPLTALAAAADEDGDTGTNAPEREATDTTPRPRNVPNIRKEADSEGQPARPPAVPHRNLPAAAQVSSAVVSVLPNPHRLERPRPAAFSADCSVPLNNKLSNHHPNTKLTLWHSASFNVSRNSSPEKKTSKAARAWSSTVKNWRTASPCSTMACLKSTPSNAWARAPLLDRSTRDA
jgi:membrane peptidoglycan carboxypeptidase